MYKYWSKAFNIYETEINFLLFVSLQHFHEWQTSNSILVIDNADTLLMIWFEYTLLDRSHNPHTSFQCLIYVALISFSDYEQMITILPHQVRKHENHHNLQSSLLELSNHTLTRTLSDVS
jgi:hypothetical protein